MKRATRKSTRPAGASQSVKPAINTLRIADGLNDMIGRLVVVGLAVQGAATETDHDHVLGPVVTMLGSMSTDLREIIDELGPPPAETIESYQQKVADSLKLIEIFGDLSPADKAKFIAQAMAHFA